MRGCNHYLFYSDNITDDIISLGSSETNHAVSVLRIKIGQQIQATDGDGVIYNCQCTGISKQSMSCKILDKTAVPKLTPELTLLAGIPDKEHFETILEHAAALGISRIIPLVMDNCRNPWWESWEKLRERFMSKMVVSMKQCLYPYLPRLDAPAPLDSVIDKCEKPLIIADQYGKGFNSLDLSACPKINCLVGPPGGLSLRELNLLESHNPLTVKIAQTRLRTELAATILCSRIMDTSNAH
ncbi:MAG: 16S rRNA (uracil(1498)-N(3))-methyltransferase [Chitinispirillales bacterium]|jgi:16S rRNA (uracil1498-N3)-methyltransferase|nr:16S rRNA (uracil(1498)-N(3))-methyltransferase [Chitinispirillales bacterium]